LKQTIIPELGREYIEPDEASDTAAIIDAIKERLSKEYPGKILRQFHAKMHGCVKATFTVLADIPQNFQHGFLVPGKSYEAIIRFSNGNTKVADDRKADLRGMAIKLLNVEGEMLQQDKDHPQSQDFLLVSHPTLMSSTVKQFRKNIEAICKGALGLVIFSLNPANWPTVFRTLQSMKKCGSILNLQYYSVSPFRLHAADVAVKYAAAPVSNTAIPIKKHKNFLREEMSQRLSADSVIFDFMVQLQEDPVEMPIEDACKEWKSSWHKVATIEIPPQQFDNAQQDAFGENLSFSPWHCLKEHQPLGGISRARKATYEAIANFRLEKNRS